MTKKYTIASYRLSSMRVLATLFLLLALVAGTIFIVDPFQHYREASFYTPMFEYHRYLAPGMAKHFNYDTALIGTSMSANYYLPHVNRAFGANTVNLSLTGATPTEQGLLLGLVAKAGKAKRVILEINVFALDIKRKYRLAPFPLYLYDDNALNDLKYLLNFFPLKISWYVFEGNRLGKRADKFDPDAAFNFPAKYVFAKKRAYEAYRKEYQELDKEAPLPREGSFYENVSRNFDEHLLPAIKDNPDMEFHLFFPPFSYLYWLSPVQAGKAGVEEMEDFYRHVLEATRGLQNARLHDFHSELDIVMDLNNYMDMNHHSREIGERVMGTMSAGTNLITDKTIEEHIDGFRKMLTSVNMEALHREMGIQ